jgi:hypothetical protein
MKVFTIECKCTTKIKLTGIQFDDFDYGIMGTLYCPNCKEILLPTDSRTNKEIKTTIIEKEGKDPGWS